MAHSLSLIHPYTGVAILEANRAMGGGTLVHHPTGSSFEASFEIGRTEFPELQRRIVKVSRDIGETSETVFSGLVTDAPVLDKKKPIKTLKLDGVYQRLYETLLDEKVVPGGDIGAMVRRVLGNPKNIPKGLKWDNTGVSKVPNFGFKLGRRLTKRRESVGAFLDEMRKYLPGFFVPEEDKDYNALLKVFPELRNYERGEFVLGATWGVLDDAIFFSRRNTTQKLVENVDCFVFESESVSSQDLVTVVRWDIDQLNLRGMANALQAINNVTDLDAIRYTPVLSKLGGTPTNSPYNEASLVFDFADNYKVAGSWGYGDTRDYFGEGETISFDVETPRAKKYGRAMKAFAVDDVEAVFENADIPLSWLTVKGGFLSATTEYLKRGRPCKVRPTTDGVVIFTLSANDLASYADGFYVDAPGAEVAWYLHYSATSHYMLPDPETKHGWSNNPGGSRVFLFSKKMLEFPEIAGYKSNLQRLVVALKFADKENVGNIYETSVSTGLPNKFYVEDSVDFEYTAKQGERFRILDSQLQQYLEVRVNGGTPRTLPTVVTQGQKVTFRLSPSYGGGRVLCELNTVHEFSMPVTGPITVWRTETELENQQHGEDVQLTNVNYDTFELPPRNYATHVYMRFFKLDGRTAKVKVWGQPTMERTVNALYLVKKNETLLTRLAQDLFVTPSDINATVVCTRFVKPTRTIEIEGRGKLYPSRFTDNFSPESNNTIIAVGQPDNADSETLRALVEGRIQDLQGTP